MSTKNVPLQLSLEGKKTYVKLIKAFPLISISDDASLRSAQKMLDRLFEHEPLNDGEEAYLATLSDLIEHHEEHNVDMGQATDSDVLRTLMDAHKLNQSEFAEKIGISKSIISELLSGKRQLNRQQIDAIANEFGISKDTFQL